MSNSTQHTPKQRFADLRHALRAVDVTRGMTVTTPEFRRCMSLLRSASDYERAALQALCWQSCDKLAAKAQA